MSAMYPWRDQAGAGTGDFRNYYSYCFHASSSSSSTQVERQRGSSRRHDMRTERTVGITASSVHLEDCLGMTGVVCAKRSRKLHLAPDTTSPSHAQHHSRNGYPYSTARPAQAGAEVVPGADEQRKQEAPSMKSLMAHTCYPFQMLAPLSRQSVSCDLSCVFLAVGAICVVRNKDKRALEFELRVGWECRPREVMLYPV